MSVEELVESAEQALERGDYEKAIADAEAALEIDAGSDEASETLAAAKLEKSLAGLYADARGLERQQKWEWATKAYRSIGALDPDYRDSAIRLRNAERQAKLLDYYLQGRAYEKQEEWAKAKWAYGEVVKLDSDYRDAAERLKDMEDRLAPKSSGGGGGGSGGSGSGGGSGGSGGGGSGGGFGGGSGGSGGGFR